MEANEWDVMGTAERGRALMVSGVPDREEEEPTMYEVQDWDSLPVEVQDGLRLLPMDWRKISPYEK